MNAPLKLIRSNDRAIVFESRVGRNWIFVGLGAPMVAVAIAAQGPGRLGARIGFLAVGSLLAWAGVAAVLWRERLVLDLLGQQFRRDRGYIWQIGTQTGSLDEIEEIALSTELRGGGRGGTYTVLILEVRFRQPIEAVKIEGFRTEGDARELIVLLSQTLHVPFIDRTVQPTRQVEWKDVAKPLVERDSEKRRGISAAEAIPPPPTASGIEVSRGVSPTIIGSLFSFIAVSGILQGISSILAREYVRDEGHTLVVGKRLWWMAYARSTVAKDAVMDIAMSPIQSAEGNDARIQRAMREKLPSIGNWQASVAILQKEGRQTLGGTLTSSEQQWLIDALRAMCESRA